MGPLYRKVDIRDKKLRKTAPNALQLLKMGEDGKLAVDKDVLQLFDNQEIQDKKVCIISVAGAMRQGKSFLLNFFLHFLNKKCQKGETKKNWISREGNLQTGFFWKTQSERVTEGILIWSEVFLTKVDDEEIAVVLMDTQGTFDNDLNMAQVTCLFATSVLISSVQIYNIKNQIALNDLHNLQFFAEYAKFQQNNRKPFQKLLILVRDWCIPFEYPFGENGGDKLLSSVFAKHEKSNQNDIPETIVANFEEVGAFLLPFPGEDVMQNPDFAGRFKDISKKFLDHVEDLVSSLLDPEKLIPKQIGGKYVSIGSLPTYVNSYLESFRREKNPTIKTTFEATCEAHIIELVKELKREYRALMDNCWSFAKATEIMEWILNKFRSERKMGSNTNFNQMHEQLKNVNDTGQQILEKWKVISALLVLNLKFVLPHQDLEKIFFSYKSKIKRKEFLRNLGSYFRIGSEVGGGIGSAVGGTAAAVQVGTVLTGATTALEGATILSAVGTVAGGIALGAVGGIFAGVLAVGGFALKYLSSSDNKGEPAARAIEKTNEEKKN